MDEKFEVRGVGGSSSEDFGEGEEIWLDFRTSVRWGGVDGFGFFGQCIIYSIIVIGNHNRSGVSCIFVIINIYDIFHSIGNDHLVGKDNLLERYLYIVPFYDPISMNRKGVYYPTILQQFYENFLIIRDVQVWESRGAIDEESLRGREPEEVSCISQNDESS